MFAFQVVQQNLIALFRHAETVVTVAAPVDFAIDDRHPWQTVLSEITGGHPITNDVLELGRRHRGELQFRVWNIDHLDHPLHAAGRHLRHARGHRLERHDCLLGADADLALLGRLLATDDLDEGIWRLPHRHLTAAAHHSQRRPGRLLAADPDGLHRHVFRGTENAVAPGAELAHGGRLRADRADDLLPAADRAGRLLRPDRDDRLLDGLLR